MAGTKKFTPKWNNAPFRILIAFKPQQEVSSGTASENYEAWDLIHKSAFRCCNAQNYIYYNHTVMHLQPEWPDLYSLMARQ